VHEFDRAPHIADAGAEAVREAPGEIDLHAVHLWQPSLNGRPHRLSGNWVAELPFGAGKPFLNGGGIFASLLRGWQTSGTFEYQPGALLAWGNIFFHGDLNDIAVANPTLERWFNTDAGFERDPAVSSPDRSGTRCIRQPALGPTPYAPPSVSIRTRVRSVAACWRQPLVGVPPAQSPTCLPPTPSTAPVQ
jgi:hypothetical protein